MKQKLLKTFFCLFLVIVSFSGCTSTKSTLELMYDASCDWATNWLANESDILKSNIECSPYIDGESVTYSHNEIISYDKYPGKDFACRVYKVIGNMTYINPMGVEISPPFVMHLYRYDDTYNGIDPILQAATNQGIDDFDCVEMKSFAGVDIDEID